MEDDDFSYRVSRKYKLVLNPDIRLVHLCSEPNKGERKEIQIMQVMNHYYFFRKNMPKTVLTWFSFFWSEIGRLLYELLRGKPKLFWFRWTGFAKVIKNILLIR